MFSLHLTPVSVDCHKVLVLCRHLELTPHLTMVEAVQYESTRAAYLDLNPSGTFPFLVDGGLTLWEPNLILQYIAENYGDHRLWSRDARGQAKIARWLSWESGYWQPALCQALDLALSPSIFGDDDRRFNTYSGALRLDDVARELEQHLEGRRYIEGDALSLADLAICASLLHTSQLHFPRGSMPNIEALHARIATLPAWQAVAPTLLALRALRSPTRPAPPSLSVWLQTPQSSSEIAAALSHCLQLPHSEVGHKPSSSCASQELAPAVQFELFAVRSSCFPQRIEVSGNHGLRTHRALAVALAEHFAQDTLALLTAVDGPMHEIPAARILVSHYDEVHLAFVRETEDSDLELEGEPWLHWYP